MTMTVPPYGHFTELQATMAAALHRAGHLPVTSNQAAARAGRSITLTAARRFARLGLATINTDDPDRHVASPTDALGPVVEQLTELVRVANLPPDRRAAHRDRQRRAAMADARRALADNHLAALRAERAAMLADHEAGTPVRDIARRLGTSHQAVYRRLATARTQRELDQQEATTDGD